MSERRTYDRAGPVMRRLEGRVTLVTGAASGIGRAQAEAFAAEGAAVVVADRNGDGAQEVAETIRASGARALAVTMDVADRESVAVGVAEAVGTLGPVTLLSNNAGMFDHHSDVMRTDVEDWQRIVDVNLSSVYHVVREVIPLMRDAGGGAMVTIASGAGLRGGGGGAGYTATKHGVIGLTKHISARFGRHGIRANTIAPGMIETPMVQRYTSGEAAAAFMRKLPAQRAGLPADIAKAAVFLLSDEADYIHATTLNVDGGMLEVLNLT